MAARDVIETMIVTEIATATMIVTSAVAVAAIVIATMIVVAEAQGAVGAEAVVLTVQTWIRESEETVSEINFARVVELKDVILSLQAEAQKLNVEMVKAQTRMEDLYKASEPIAKELAAAFHALSTAIGIVPERGPELTSTAADLRDIGVDVSALAVAA